MTSATGPLPLAVVCVPSTSPVHFPLKGKRSQYTHGQREVILTTYAVEMRVVITARLASMRSPSAQLRTNSADRPRRGPWEPLAGKWAVHLRCAKEVATLRCRRRDSIGEVGAIFTAGECKAMSRARKVTSS
jgi:hypothetical protein